MEIENIISEEMPEEGKSYEYLENLDNHFSSNTTTLNLYMQTIGKIPLLSAQEEVELANLISQGDQTALNKLVESNLRLVVHVAKKYSSNATQSLLDLIQEGNIGLIKAAKKFEPSKGCRFSTYATYWIRQAISQSVNDYSRTIRIPNNSILILSKINKVINLLNENGDEDPTDEAIANLLDLDVNEVHNLRNISQPIYSLDFIVSDDKETNAIDLIPDTNCQSPEDYSRDEDKRQGIIQILETLPERDKEILIMRYGLISHVPATLDEIGQRFNLTRERVRQLEIKAMRKLRAPARVKALKEIV